MKAVKPQSWLITGSLALLSAAYVWFVFLPGKAALARSETELNDKRAFVASGSALVLNIGRIENERTQTRSYIEKWQPGPGGSAAAAACFGRIAQVLQQAGVTTTRFAPEAVVKFESLDKLPLHISCSGSFADICRMLESLEKVDERCWIDELALEQGTEDGQTVKCDLSLAIFTDNSKKSN